MKKCCLLLAVLLLWTLPAGAWPVVVGNFGKQAELLNYVQNEDGSYAETLLADDMILITTGRELREEGVNDTIDNLLDSAYSDVYDIAIMPVEPVGWNYTERVRFHQGSEEAVNIVDLVHISDTAGPWIFYAEISVPSDLHEEYEELVEIWIESLDVFDDSMGEAYVSVDPEEIESPDRPLEWDDVAAYIRLQEQEGAGTVQDLVEMFEPQRFQWVRLEEGIMHLELVCEGGWMSVQLYGETELGDSWDAATDLPVSVLEMSYVFESVQWTSAGFPLYPPRGLYVGDSMEGVIEAYAGGERIPMLSTDSALPVIDEAIAYTIPVEGVENEYAELTYSGCDGVIETIMLRYVVDEAGNMEEALLEFFKAD